MQASFRVTRTASRGTPVGRRWPNRCSIEEVDRRYELEVLRRSLAMLSPGVRALTREEAIGLVEELAEVQDQLGRLREGLRRLIEDDGATT